MSKLSDDVLQDLKDAFDMARAGSLEEITASAARAFVELVGVATDVLTDVRDQMRREASRDRDRRNP